MNNDWLLEEGWASYLVSDSPCYLCAGTGSFVDIQQGCHFVRCGVEGLGGELQRRGIARQAQWGARGIVYVLAKCFPLSCLTSLCSNNLSSRLDNRSQLSLKRHIFSSEVAVQTDSVIVSTSHSPDNYHRSKSGSTEEDQISSLTAADLGSILKWSKEISSDINLSLALQKLTEIATGTSLATRSFAPETYILTLSQNHLVVR